MLSMPVSTSIEILVEAAKMPKTLGADMKAHKSCRTTLRATVGTSRLAVSKGQIACNDD
jgi:hypothetical protein